LFVYGDAVDQIFYQSGTGWTAIIYACYRSAPLVLVRVMITKVKLDSRKRCLLASTTNYARLTALHYSAMNHNNSAVLELLIR